MDLKSMIILTAVTSAVITLNGCNEGGSPDEKVEIQIEDSSAVPEEIQKEGSREYYTSLCQGKTFKEIVDLFGGLHTIGSQDYVDNGTSGYIDLTYWKYQFPGKDNYLHIIIDRDTQMFLEVREHYQN